MRITFDAHANTLVFGIAEEPATGSSTVELDATIDIGARGRLLALTIDLPGGGEAELEIEPGDDPLARAARVRVSATLDANGGLHAVTLPRVGHGYEITYPSGNQ